MIYEDKKRIIKLVAEANPERNVRNIDRRVHKIFEEIGELCEAYLTATAAASYKHKTGADVCEEAADVLIVAIDIALTKLDDRDYPNVWDLFDDMIPYGMSYDRTIWEIASEAAAFGKCYEIELEQYKAEEHRFNMVVAAFDLVEMVFEKWSDTKDQRGIIPEIERKLAKWARSRNNKVVVTDSGE